MSSLSFIVQCLLSSSLLVGAFLLARKAQKDTRLLPAAIVLFLFAVPIPIFASLFPGEDQLREFTSIKYGPPVAAFVESGIQQGPFTLPEGLSEKTGSNSSESQLKSGFQPSGSTGDAEPGPELGFGEPQKNGTLMLNALTIGSQLAVKAPSPWGNSIEATEKKSSSSFEVEEHGFEDASVANVTQGETNSSSTGNSTANPNNTSPGSLDYCLEKLSSGTWKSAPLPEVQSNGSLSSVENGTYGGVAWSPEKIWEWDALAVRLCNFTTWGRLEGLKLLARAGESTSAGKIPEQRRSSAKSLGRTVSARSTGSEVIDGPVTRIVVAGDSQGRLVALALLRLLRGIGDDEMGAFQQKHSDWNVTIAEGRLSVEFWWTPFAHNVTERLRRGAAAEAPDVLVMSFGLWHMLYTNDPEDYGRGLRKLQSTLQEGYRIRGGPLPLLFWLNNPFLITERLNTEAKRMRLTGNLLRAYNVKALESGLLWPKGRVLLLDLFDLTRKCGDSCAADGMHYIQEAYDTVVQSMLNAVALILNQ